MEYNKDVMDNKAKDKQIAKANRYEKLENLLEMPKYHLFIQEIDKRLAKIEDIIDNDLWYFMNRVSKSFKDIQIMTRKSLEEVRHLLDWDLPVEFEELTKYIDGVITSYENTIRNDEAIECIAKTYTKKSYYIRIGKELLRIKRYVKTSMIMIEKTS